MSRFQIYVPIFFSCAFFISLFDFSYDISFLGRLMLIIFLLSLFAVGVLLTIIGVVLWVVPNKGNANIHHRGRKVMVKGLALICFSLLLCGISSFLFDFLNLL